MTHAVVIKWENTMIKKTVFKSRAEWLKYRESGLVIGSSDVGTIMGLNKYCTPLQWWTKRMESKDPTGNTYRGQYMEDGVAMWFERVTGNKVIRRSSEISVFHNTDLPEYMECAPDREVFQAGRKCRPFLEVKDTKMIIDLNDLGSIPDNWFAQIQWQMGVAARQQTFLCICDGNKSLQYRLFDFDKAYFDHLVEYVTSWVYRHVVEGVQPEPTTADDVTSLYPQSADKVKRVGADIFDMWEILTAKRKKLSELTSEIDELKDKLAAVFDDSDTIEFEGARLATFKTQVRKSIDSKRLNEDHPDLYSEYLVEKSIRTLLVK